MKFASVQNIQYPRSMRIDDARSLKPALPRSDSTSVLTVYERPWKFCPSYSTTRAPPPQPPPPALPPPPPPPAFCGIGRAELTRPVTLPRFGHRPGPSTS